MFNVPRAGRYKLRRPPLVQALVQVRYPLSAQFQRLADVAEIQAKLAHILPYMAQSESQLVSMAIGGGEASPSESSISSASSILWRFSDDKSWSFVLEPSIATLAVGSDYEGMDDFADRFSEVLSVLADSGDFRRCERIGVRYVNHVDIPPGMTGNWTEWFKPELTGWSGTTLLGEGADLTSDITQSQFRYRPVESFATTPGDIHSLIHFGLLPPGTLVDLNPPRTLKQNAYLLDVDMFIQANQNFEVTNLVAQFRLLHEQIDSFFRWSLTEQGAEHFGLEEVI